MTYLAIIPARGGSKGLPRKNILDLAGLPLLAWSIKQAKEVQKIERVLVSTDDSEIAQIAEKYGAEVPFLRPKELSQDSTATEPVLLHALDFYKSNFNFTPQNIILLQPTSPLRLKNSLTDALNYFEEKNFDSLLSVCENHHFFWKNKNHPIALYDFNNRPRRQDITEENKSYRENGSIYISNVDKFKEFKNRLFGRIGLYSMSEQESWEIDSEIDFKIMDFLMRTYLKC